MLNNLLENETMRNRRSNNQAAISAMTSSKIQPRRAPLNRTKKVLFKEAIDFAADNGYLFAVYDRSGDNFVLKDDAYMSRVHELEEIIVEVVGSGVSFNDFTTADGNHCFRLHNNFNVPAIIPIIKR